MIYISFDIGVKNLALCILRKEEDKVTIIDWEVICLAEKKRQLKGINNIAEVIYYELDNIIGKLQGINETQIDKVIIENQPSNLNGIMKTIQFIIFCYFDLLRHWDNIVGEVILINPRQKLLNHSYVPVETAWGGSGKQDKYKKNKKDSIEICKYYIKNDAVLQSFFDKHKKKDDLADTCLQTVSYIRQGGCLVEELVVDEVALIT